MRFFNWLFRREKMVRLGVTITEKDPAYTAPIPLTKEALVGSSKGGPAVEFIGPKMRPILWCQFWRWHLIPAYNRECREARERLNELFGDV